MKAQRHALATILRRITGLALATALGTVALVVVLSSFALKLVDVRDTTRVQAKVLAENASAALVFSDEKAAQEVLESLRHSPDIEAASLHSTDGRRFGSYRRKGAPRRSAPEPAAGRFELLPTYLTLSESVMSPQGVVGHLDVVVSLATLYEETGALALATAVAMLLALAMCTLLLRHLRVSILQPLEALNASMASVARHADFSVRAADSEIVELHSLGTAFNAMLAQIQERDARNAALLNAIPDLLFELDIDGRYMDYHAPDAELLVTPAANFLGRLVTDVLPPLAAEVCMAALRDADKHGSSTGNQFELRLPQGTCWFELSVSRKAALAGSKRHFIVLSRDITAHKQAEQRVSRLAYFDSLTGLPNRQAFLQRLGREIKRAQHTENRLGILFMDLDGFKHINDTRGHSAGDLILQSAADRLRESLRPSDVVSRATEAATAATPADIEVEIELARLGGDEFTALILDVARPEDCVVVAHRILELMRRPFVIQGEEVMLTTSIGIALYPNDGEDAASLLKHADTAMYHAKELGRDNYQFYNASLTRQAMQAMEKKARLRVALERDEFSLAYQPQIDAISGRIQSVEALIRWTHPELGAIAPLDFIPLAEQNGSILPIGEWVLRTACTDAARWQRDGESLRLAVNLSPLQFKDSGLVQMVADALAHSGLAPELLELEITEGALMEDTAATMATLNAFRNMGVRIALDDFGTGYSSLAYLKRMPLNALKVDRSFVTGLPHDSENLAIVRAILAMAHSLGLGVTAEGVETLEQARSLKTMACDSFQGYFFSRPVPAVDIPGLLDRCWVQDEALQGHAAAAHASDPPSEIRPLQGAAGEAHDSAAP